MGSSQLVTLGWAAISWIEHYLVHGPGDVQGQPVELDDEFAGFILKAYRLDPTSGARRVRRAFLSRPKGRSKSGLAGFIEVFEALGPCRFDHWAEAGEVSDWGYEFEIGEPVGAPLTYVEILNVATEEGQAGNTYDAVYYALNPETCSDALLEDFGRLDVGLTRINLPSSRGFIEPVTASNESKDGGKSTFIVADETHLWIPPANGGAFKLGKMHQTMVRNLLKRKMASGWMLETSTMYGTGEKSVAEGTHTYAEQQAKAGRSDGKLLFDHRQASEHWDLDNRVERLKALNEAYGPAAAWMDLEAIADYWDDPQATHAEFRRFFLNQPVPMIEESVEGDLAFGTWKDLADADAERGTEVCFGADVAEDRSAWVAVAWRREVDDAVQVMLVNDGRALPAHRLAAEAKRLTDEWAGPVMGPRSFEDDFDKAGVDVLPPMPAPDVAEACSQFDNLIRSGEIRHGNQLALNDSVRLVKWRKSSNPAERSFQLAGAPEAGPVMAVVRAIHGLEKYQSGFAIH